MTYLDEEAARIRRHLPPGTSVPDGGERLFRLYAVLLRAKGKAVTAQDVHDVWSAWMQEEDPEHEAIQPYDDLAPDVQAEDQPFLTAILDAVPTT